MRSMLEIICAVKDCETVTEEELRLCVRCLSAKLHLAKHDRDKFVEIIDSSEVIDQLAAMRLKFRSGLVKIERELSFKSDKIPMDEYLGPRNIPGTTEQRADMKWAKTVFEKSTGKTL